METLASSIVRYMIDASHSKFTVQAFAGGMLSAFGHNPNFAIRDFTGEAELRPESLESASVRLRIPTMSITLQDEIKEKDRREMEQTMRQEVLETDKYPEILFESTSIAANRMGEGQYRLNITGNLTLHGVTKSHSVTALVMFNGDDLRAKGDFTLLQSNFGIKLVTAVGGALKVKDELKFSFDIAGKRK
jgi:polyisoprenoid-binding protein YceI